MVCPLHDTLPAIEPEALVGMFCGGDYAGHLFPPLQPADSALATGCPRLPYDLTRSLAE